MIRQPLRAGILGSRASNAPEELPPDALRPQGNWSSYELDPIDLDDAARGWGRASPADADPVDRQRCESDRERRLEAEIRRERPLGPPAGALRLLVGRATRLQ